MSRSGLGLSICLRLIDEFIATQTPTITLHLIITTRDKLKGDDTIYRLGQRLRRRPRNERIDLGKYVFLTSEQLDLTSLRSVQALSEKLLRTLPRIDVVILNAGYGGYTAINWPRAIWQILTDFPAAVTYPTYQIAGVGYTTKRQTASLDDEPPLGQVFCSNVFGHYMLVSYLAPLLTQATSGHLASRRPRVIWISSLEAYASALSRTDIQGLASSNAYKSSKRLTDILALTSSLPSSHPGASRLLDSTEAKPPDMYLAHPGICATSFVPLNTILYYLMTLALYLARWIGSPWHTVSPHKGACAPVWLTLALQEELDALEADGKSKWGSCVDVFGNERVTRTEVEGWGLRGKIERLGAEQRRGRRRGVVDLTEEERQGFMELGRQCWEQMDELREQWRGRLAVQARSSL